MLLLLGFAFLSGFVTILAPCIWPLLPIVLSSASVGQSRFRPLGITLGIMFSFLVFTLSISYIVKLFHVDPNILRFFSVLVLVLLGLTLIIPALSTMIEGAVSKLSAVWGNRGQKQSGGFLAGFITGLSLGIVWSPRAGTILASIAALAATGRVSLQVVLVTISYACGVGLPLFIFAYGGRQIITRTRFISSFTGRIHQIFGIIMLLTAVAIYTNYDKTLEADLLNLFPQLSQNLTGFESSPLVSQQLNALKGIKTGANSTPRDTSGLFNDNTPAPDFTGATDWLNSPEPQTLANLKGKVVLVDFWTYTCINCIRTLPFVTNWYDKYKYQGFVVIGVHTPEFEFEKTTQNVQNAISRFNIHYPVPQDNNYTIWNNFNNAYWPAEYLIDANGTIRRHHFGEGEYEQTELAIQVLLKENNRKVSSGLVNLPDQTPAGSLSPETYLGSNRMQYFYPNGSVGNGKQKFALPNSIPINSFSLGGEWNITNENAITGKNAVLAYHFTANKVFLVLRSGSAGSQAKAKVLLDGKPVSTIYAGADVVSGTVVIDKDRLYNLIDLKGKSGEHTLKLEFQDPGIEAFAFTFG